MNRSATVIGAGPGGLTAAIALQRAGLTPHVYERAGALRTDGAGLTLWPNALETLEHIELYDAVRAIGQPLSGIGMRTSDGTQLFGVDPDTLERRFGKPGLVVHRAELLGVLADALGRDAIAFDAHCTGFHTNGAGPVALFDDASTVHGEVLIGADGMRSQTRALVVGDMPLRYAGYSVWRGLAHHRLDEGCGWTTMGRGAQFGYFPMTDDRVYWFASKNAPEGSAHEPARHKEAVLDHFSDWHAPIRDLVTATDEADIVRNDVYDCDPLERWSEGSVTLLGDAAHPATPDLGQGACQAIEDAVVLGLSLVSCDDPATALAAYEARRRRRANAFLKQARQLGKMGRWSHPLACRLRRALIQKMPERIRLKQLGWMFDFDPKGPAR